MKKQFCLQEKQKAFLFLIKEVGCTQRDAQRFIARGRLLVAGKPVLKDQEEICGDIEFITFNPVSRGMRPTYEADDFVVFDKPTGMLVHPQNRHTEYSLIDEIKAQYGMDANIVHRIDKETSGLVLCAKDKESEKILKVMFEHKAIEKEYIALVHGKLKDAFTCKAPLQVSKDTSSGVLRSIVNVSEDGKRSETSFAPIRYFKELDMTLVRCFPSTGRQHQIRVHLFHVKHPIVGDPLYGVSNDTTTRYLNRELSEQERLQLTDASRLLLHAERLRFVYKEKEFLIQSKVDFEKTFYQYVNNFKKDECS